MTTTTATKTHSNLVVLEFQLFPAETRNKNTESSNLCTNTNKNSNKVRVFYHLTLQVGILWGALILGRCLSPSPLVNGLLLLLLKWLSSSYSFSNDFWPYINSTSSTLNNNKNVTTAAASKLYTQFIVRNWRFFRYLFWNPS